MSYFTKKTVYKLMTNERITGFEICITDEGVEIETVNGLRLPEFIEVMDALLIQLKRDYEDLK